jgi:hypothetical protein
MYISIFCERVYDLEYWSKSDVSVCLLVCCVVQRLLHKYKKLLSLVPSFKRTKTKNVHQLLKPKTCKYQNQQPLNERFTTDTSIKTLTHPWPSTTSSLARYATTAATWELLPYINGKYATPLHQANILNFNIAYLNNILNYT